MDMAPVKPMKTLLQIQNTYISLLTVLPKMSSVEVVCDPLSEGREPGEDIRSSIAAPPGSARQDTHHLPGGELVLPGQQRSSTVATAASSLSQASGTEMVLRSGQSILSLSISRSLGL